MRCEECAWYVIWDIWFVKTIMKNQCNIACEQNILYIVCHFESSCNFTQKCENNTCVYLGNIKC